MSVEFHVYILSTQKPRQEVRYEFEANLCSTGGYPDYKMTPYLKNPSTKPNQAKPSKQSNKTLLSTMRARRMEKAQFPQRLVRLSSFQASIGFSGG